MFFKRLNHPFYDADGGGGAGSGGGAAAGSDGAAGGAAGGGGQTGGNDGSQTIELPKTNEELAAYLKAETEKVLKTSQTEWQKDFDTKVQAAVAEAERLAKLSAEDKQKEELQKKQDELSKKEKEIFQKDLEIKTIDMLKEKSLPLDFKPYVIGSDEATTKERLEAFDKVWKSAIESAVNEKLKGTTPFHTTSSSAANPGFYDSITKNQYRR